MEKINFKDVTAENLQGKFGDDKIKVDLLEDHYYVIPTNLGIKGATVNTKVKVLYNDSKYHNSVIIVMVYNNDGKYIGIQDFYYNGSEQRFKILTWYADMIDWQTSFRSDCKAPDWFYDIKRINVSKILSGPNFFRIIHEHYGTFSIDKYDGYGHHVELTELSSTDLVVLRDELTKVINKLDAQFGSVEAYYNK